MKTESILTQIDNAEHEFVWALQHGTQSETDKAAAVLNKLRKRAKEMASNDARPTQAEIMDYCVENFTPPETPQGLERLERIAKRNIIAQLQKDALEKRGFKFNIS